MSSQWKMSYALGPMIVCGLMCIPGILFMQGAWGSPPAELCTLNRTSNFTCEAVTTGSRGSYRTQRRFRFDHVEMEGSVNRTCHMIGPLEESIDKCTSDAMFLISETPIVECYLYMDTDGDGCTTSHKPVQYSVRYWLGLCMAIFVPMTSFFCLTIARTAWIRRQWGPQRGDQLDDNQLSGVAVVNATPVPVGHDQPPVQARVVSAWRAGSCPLTSELTSPTSLESEGPRAAVACSGSV